MGQRGMITFQGVEVNKQVPQGIFVPHVSGYNIQDEADGRSIPQSTGGGLKAAAGGGHSEGGQGRLRTTAHAGAAETSHMGISMGSSHRAPPINQGVATAPFRTDAAGGVGVGHSRSESTRTGARQSSASQAGTRGGDHLVMASASTHAAQQRSPSTQSVGGPNNASWVDDCSYV